MSRWTREAALLGMPDLPEDAFKHDGDRKIKPQGGGGGGGTTTATQYTSNVPEYAKGEFMDLVGKAEALSNAPYQAYTGERTAQFTPLQQQAFGAAQNQQTAGQLGLGTNIAAYTGMNSFTQPGTAGAYMSPFVQNAMAPQLREQARQSAIQGTEQQAQATQRGAFGGSRDAIMRAERERNLGQLQSDTLAKGYQTAFEQAQGQYNQEQAQRLQAAGALGQLGQQQFGQQMDITNLQNQLGTAQQAQVQKVLDQQYGDFQNQLNYPYQQLGFLSDVLRGSGGSTRSVYQAPQAGGLQTIAGLGSALYGASQMAEGGEVRGYASGGAVKGFADGGITGLLSDQQLAQRAQTPGMAGLAAQGEAAQRAEIRADVPQGIPTEDAPDLTEQEVLELLKEALATGDERLAAAAQEVLTNIRAKNEQGLAALAPDSVGDITAGGITGMADGGVVAFAGGGDVREVLMKSPYARTAEDIALLERSGYPVQRKSIPQNSGIWAADRAVASVVPNLRASATGNASYLSEEELAKQPDLPGVLSERFLRFAGASPMSREESSPIPSKVGIGSGRGTTVGPTAEQLAELHKKEAPPPFPGNAAVGIPDSGFGSSRAGVGVSMPTIGKYPLDVNALESEGRKRREDYIGAERSKLEQERKDLDAEIAARGVYGEDREKRANEGLAALTGKEDKAEAMGWIQAGLAMLSADPAKGAWAAIGGGAAQGLSAYKGDMEKIDAKRQKLVETLDSISDKRREEAIATGKERRAITSQINGLEALGKKLNMELGDEIGLKIKPKMAETMFDAQTRMAAAKMQADATIAARASSGKSTSELRDDAIRAYQSAQKDIGSDLSKDPTYMLAKPAEKAKMQQAALQAWIRNNPHVVELLPGLSNIGIPRTVSAPTGKVRE